METVNEGQIWLTLGLMQTFISLYCMAVGSINASVIGKMILKVKIVSDSSVARLDYIWKILAANFLTKAAKIFGDFFFGCFLKMALF